VGLVDISVPLAPRLPTWDDEPIRVERTMAIAAGDPVNLTELELPVHTGTHVDAPLHFVDGAPSLDQVPLDTWLGPALVVDATEARERIGRALVERLVPPGTERVLFKTRSAGLWDLGRFSSEYVCLDADGAAAVVERGVRLAGIDYLTIADDEGHRTLFRAGVAALEGLDLRAVEPGRYRLLCLPLSIPGADGAPARALLEGPL
jgi:arylformamidase